MAETDDRGAFEAAFIVSRETSERLACYVEILKDWNTRHNLVAPATLAEVWTRHILDSAQMAAFIPENAKTLADLGSGAGFPGLVLALLFEGRLDVSLFEATHKKCEFLAAAAEKMALKVSIRNERVEDARPFGYDVVSSRACAPLPKLLGYAARCIGPHSICLFPKGENYRAELTEAQKSWRMTLATHPSQTHKSGVILEISQLKPLRLTPRQRQHP
ncbi:MAG: 16S rRNA (guanine(527)-N(7))-methyltransferase RsmG [Rhizomicrobium sp.]